jgi:hypothetical protein
VVFSPRWRARRISCRTRLPRATGSLTCRPHHRSDSHRRSHAHRACLLAEVPGLWIAGTVSSSGAVSLMALSVRVCGVTLADPFLLNREAPSQTEQHAADERFSCSPNRVHRAKVAHRSGDIYVEVVFTLVDKGRSMVFAHRGFGRVERNRGIRRDAGCFWTTLDATRWIGGERRAAGARSRRQRSRNSANTNRGCGPDHGNGPAGDAVSSRWKLGYLSKRRDGWRSRALDI